MRETSSFCRSFAECSAKPAVEELRRGIGTRNLGTSTSHSRNVGIAIGITVERDRVGRDGKRLVTLRKQSSASSASSASGDYDGPHADDSPVADDDDDSPFGRPAGEIQRKSRDAGNGDDADDVLRPSHDSDYSGPFQENF